MAIATSPSEAVHSLHHLMTTAIWREALAIKQRNPVAKAHAADQRERASARLLRLGDRWGSDQPADESAPA